LVAFLGSGLMARTMGSLITVQGSDGPIPLQRDLFERFFAGWLTPANASLAFAVAFVVLWFFVLKGFERKGWFLKL
jgi:predicted acyltransferase